MNIFFVGLLLGLPRTVCAVGPGAISAGLRERFGARVGGADCNALRVAGQGRVFRSRPPTDL